VGANKTQPESKNLYWYATEKLTASLKNKISYCKQHDRCKIAAKHTSQEPKQPRHQSPNNSYRLIGRELRKSCT